MQASCLQISGAGSALIVTRLADKFGGTFISMFAVAAVLAPFVRRQYRRRIARLMQFETQHEAPDAWWDAHGSPARYAGTASAADLARSSGERDRAITRATYAAWLAFVIVMIPLVVVATDGLLFDVARGIAVVAVAALGAVVINLPSPAPRWLVWAPAIALPLLLWPSVIGRGNVIAQLLLTVVAVALGYTSLVHRALRGMVPPMLVLIGGALVCVQLYLFAGPRLAHCIGGAHAEQSTYVEYIGISAAIALGGWLGLTMLEGVAKVVERGALTELWLSSQIVFIVVSGGVFVYALPTSMANIMQMSALGLGAIAAAMVSYNRVVGHPVSAPGPELLVLRVFADKSSMQALLDQVQSRWRTIGAVHQIGGPDLAAMNIDPIESTRFFGGRMHEMFLPSVPSPAHVLGRLVRTADRDGRYRINEVFCLNSAWRATVEALMDTAHAIVLDVRGLTRQRAGTAYEINVLARAALLSRVVAVGDDTTDWGYVDEILVANERAPDELPRMTLASRGEAGALYERLLAIAGGSAVHA